MGRITSGVKLINLDEGVKVASIAKVRQEIPSDETQDNQELQEKEDIQAQAGQDIKSDEQHQPNVNKEVQENKNDIAVQGNNMPTADSGIDKLLERAEEDQKLQENQQEDN